MTISELYKTYQEFPVICTDSRNIQKDSIFFALKGENFNGNKFAETALKNGANYAIVDQKEYVVNDNYILVNNCLDTLQKLANYHRKKSKAKIIGLTGSNGKTTSKELILSNQFLRRSTFSFLI